MSLDGYSFASKGEASCYAYLKADPSIRILRTQVRIPLTLAKIVYIPDFECEYVNTGENFWVEYKGVETATWRIKRRLWKHYGPGLLQIYKGSYKAVRLHEEIIPCSYPDAHASPHSLPSGE